MPTSLRRALLGPALSLVALGLPLTALAEPAVIAVFEAVARAEPSADAAPVQTLVEGTSVSVSEEAAAGWRRVRLADGGTAWIEERALTFPARSAAAAPGTTPEPAQPSALRTAPAAVAPDPSVAPPPPTTSPGPPSDLRVRLYVKDLDHLAELVKSDVRAGPLAAQLTSRRITALTVGGVGLAAATCFFIYGNSQFDKHSGLNDPQFGQTGNAMGAFTAGSITALVSVVAAVAIAPKQGDLLDVINVWNEGHPSEQFTLGEHHLER